MTEKKIMNEILIAASAAGHRLWRNNVGTGWVGIPIRTPARTSTIYGSDHILLKNPRPLHAGLCTGSSDCIGFTRVVITPEMIGRTVAVFAAVEVKTPTGQTTQEQQRFLNMVNLNGGCGITATSAEQALRGMSEFQRHWGCPPIQGNDTPK